MKKNLLLLPILLLFVLVGVFSITSVSNILSYDEIETQSKNQYQEKHKESQYISPIPLALDLNADKVTLGELFFNDKRISPNDISCAQCHQLNKGGADGLKTSKNVQGGFDTVNTQSIFNCGFNPHLFWDGRANSLEEQLEDVIHNSKHLNSNWPWIIKQFSDNPQYTKAVNTIYNESINQKNITDAIITFERSLFTPNSRFDRYLRGDDLAITLEEKQGFNLFKNYGCISCHQGVNVGGNLYAKFGVYYNPFLKKKIVTKADLGRFNITNNPKDKHVFRVPTLRNVALTAPYFHHGGVKTLKKAIKLMGKTQLGIKLPDEDIALIERFLKTLTGQYKGKNLR